MRHLTWRRPPLVDVLIAGAMLTVSFLGVRANLGIFGDAEFAPAGASAGLLILCIVPLAFRRVAPLSTAVTVGAAFLVLRFVEVAEFDMSALALFLALYGAGAFGGQRRDLVRIVVVLPGMMMVAWRLAFVDGDIADGDLFWLRASAVASNVGFFVGAWILGDGARRRRLAEDELVERTSELQHEREENEQRAVLDERVRIARELHDVVAHHVSVMGLQAGAARRALEHDPDSSRDALRSVEDSGREAVRELHQLLGFLRQDESDGSDPQPGLARLDALVDQVEEAGVVVELDIEGSLDDVPDSVSLSAYRIVQEALTNTLRHARARRASVQLVRSLDGLSVVVDDDGAPAFSPPAANGRVERRHGLLGMRERVSLHQGSFEAGPKAGGGWRVSVWLPLPAGVRR